MKAPVQTCRKMCQKCHWLQVLCRGGNGVLMRTTVDIQQLGSYTAFPFGNQKGHLELGTELC